MVNIYIIICIMIKILMDYYYKYYDIYYFKYSNLNNYINYCDMVYYDKEYNYDNNSDGLLLLL